MGLAFPGAPAGPQESSTGRSPIQDKSTRHCLPGETWLEVATGANSKEERDLGGTRQSHGISLRLEEASWGEANLGHIL